MPRWGLSVSPRSRYFPAFTETLTAERFAPHGTDLVRIPEFAVGANKQGHMTTFTLTVQDTGVQAALNALAAKVSNPTPFLRGLGDDIVERAKHRFETSTGPDGQPWKPNSAATLQALGERLLGHRNRKGARSYQFSKQGGLLNAKGLARMNAKKPLIAESGDLRRQIVAAATSTEVSVSATMTYAAIQQFGGQAGRGKKVSIPARPFLPVHQDGTLYPQEQAQLLASLNDWLADGLA